MTAVENKIPDVSGVVTKTNYNTRISEIENKVNNHSHDKYITTPELKKISKEVFDERLKRAKLVTTADFNTKVQEVEKKINENKIKNSLIETEAKKLNNFDASYFRGKNYFGDVGAQNYLVFQPSYKYLEITNDKNFSW